MQTPGTENTRRTITNIALGGFRDFFDRRSVDNPEFKVDMARLYFYAANLDRFYGDFREAEIKFTESLQLVAEATGGDVSNNKERLLALTESLRDFALMCLASGRLEESAQIISKARNPAEILQSENDRRRILPTITLVQAELAGEFGEYKKALDLYIDAEKLLQTIVDNPVADSGMQAHNEALLTMSQLNQSSALRDLGEFEEAVSLMGPVVTAAEDSLTAAGPNPRRHIRLLPLMLIWKWQEQSKLQTKMTMNASKFTWVVRSMN